MNRNFVNYKRDFFRNCRKIYHFFLFKNLKLIKEIDKNQRHADRHQSQKFYVKKTVSHDTLRS